MHAVVMDRLEEFLSGALEPGEQEAIEQHLGKCLTCRAEIRSMQEVSELFGALKSDEALEPSLGFFAGVMRNVAEQRQPAPSLAALLAQNLAFGRRLVFASLLTLAILGSYLISRENNYPAGPSPEAIMAQQDSPFFDSASGGENMLVTLTAYEQR
jgi:anti-sigma factor RsiW